MKENGIYSVSDLADQVGVPRTTINDWLAKYAQFVDSKMQGKRRVYTESALELMKKVQEFRNADLSSFEIEKKLQELFAVQAQPADEPAASDALHEETEPVVEKSTQTVSVSPESHPGPDSESYALVAKETRDALMTMANTQFSMLLEKMSMMESEAKNTAKRSRLYGIFAFLFILILAGVSAVFYFHSREMKQQFERNQADLSKMTVESKAQNEQLVSLREKAVLLDAHSTELKSNIKKLENGLTEQRNAFDKAIRDAKSNYEKTREAERKRMEAELNLQKEKFAGDRLKLLREHEQKLNQLKAELAKKDSELVRLKQQETDRKTEKSSETKPKAESKGSASVKSKK